MKKKLKIAPLNPKLKKETKVVLETALNRNFDTVIIFGFKDEDKQELHTLVSPATSRLEIIGALESAKYQFNATL